MIDEHSRLQANQQRQVLRPDLRLEVPAIKVRHSASRARPRGAGAPRAAVPAAPPAPISTVYDGSYIAEIKVL